MEKTMTLGDRMKEYETKSEREGCLDMHAPVVIRLDGCAFHTWVKKAGCQKPFDQRMVDAMQLTALDLCNAVQSCAFAYVQSDEISLVLRNDQSENAEPWFGNRLQKLCSITASMAGCFFNRHARELFGDSCPDAFFDSRVMFMPDKSEAFNCILWRQNDCVRNSVSGLAQAHFPQKMLNGVHTDSQKKMLFEKGIDWNGLDTEKKYGAIIHKELRRGVVTHWSSKENRFVDEEFTRKAFYIDREFGRVDSAKLDDVYNF